MSPPICIGLTIAICGSFAQLAWLVTASLTDDYFDTMPDFLFALQYAVEYCVVHAALLYSVCALADALLALHSDYR